MNSKSGTLYVIATPIGNLEDITFRAVKVLKKVDICAVEDTRRSRKLFNHFNIKTRLISYHKFSENRKVGYFINFLEKGKSIGLLSDAGTPLISDPGYPLIKKASEMDFNIVPIPGASALTTALSVSNLAIDKFTFYGFPSRQAKANKELIKRLSGRRVCPSCGENYHIEFRPPERNGKCDSCGDKLIQRSDDEKDTILNRLRVFSEYTKPVLGYYNNREGFTKIEGRDNPEDVWESIRKIF